jgi:hypothetical protein
MLSASFEKKPRDALHRGSIFGTYAAIVGVTLAGGLLTILSVVLAPAVASPLTADKERPEDTTLRSPEGTAKSAKNISDPLGALRGFLGVLASDSLW